MPAAGWRTSDLGLVRLPAELRLREGRDTFDVEVNHDNAATTEPIVPSLGEDATLERLHVEFEPAITDPLAGLFVGSFGPHGPEALEVHRVTLDGEEAVVGTKVVGDTNVPAGEVSFRAKVGRDRRLDIARAYPDELGVLARYAGEGRMAGRGFRDPQWVPGELLLLDGKGGELTGGAELGFVWAVPGERRFLILFNRLILT